MIGLQSIARKARLAVGLGIAKLINDGAKLQRMQISALKGELRDDVNRYQNYGFTSHPRPGSAVVTVAVGGNRNHLAIVVADDPRARKKDLAEGEVAIYHHSGDYILLKNGGEIEVVSASKVTVISPEVTVTASTKVKLDTPTCEMTGNLTVQGDATVQGTVEGSVVRTQSGKDLETHKHTGVQTGGGVSGPPQ